MMMTFNLRIISCRACFSIHRSLHFHCFSCYGLLDCFFSPLCLLYFFSLDLFSIFSFFHFHWFYLLTFTLYLFDMECLCIYVLFGIGMDLGATNEVWIA